MAEERARVLGLWTGGSRGTVLRVLILLLVIALVAATWFFQDMVPGLRQMGYLGMFLIGVVGSASIIVLPTPTLATVCAGGSLLGLNPVAVGVLAGIGGALGELLAYVVGMEGQAVLRKGRFYLRVHRWIQRRGGPTLFVLALVPNPIIDIAGMAAGALRFPVTQFLLWVTAGKVLRAVAIAVGCKVGASWIPPFL